MEKCKVRGNYIIIFAENICPRPKIKEKDNFVSTFDMLV